MTATLPDFVSSPKLDEATYDEKPAAPSRVRQFVRGRETDPTWVRPTLLTLLVGTAVLYIWGLGASGYANGFYSAAVEAGTKSWKAMFFGSFDSSNFITVDKPPAALWVMDISARIFGVNAWSILVPQALEGVAAVGLLYATVRRRFSPQAALIAGLVLATTPVATEMFRFNNPDALLVLLLVGSAYTLVRAIEDGRTRWLVWTGALVGTAFLAKMMQAFVVLPGFALVYLFAAPVPFMKRVKQVALGGVATILGAGWWVAIVTAIPASARPYVGGSQHNSILELIFGYNGFGRLTGQETGSVGGATNATGRWGPTGITRMFNGDFGGQISWLLPAALILLVAMLWLSRRAPRTNGQRAQVLIWGSWLVVTGLTFSLAAGIIHPYYTVALAPAIAALVGIGATSLWRHRRTTQARAILAATMLVTTWWSDKLLARTPTWHPGLRTAVVVTGLVATCAILALPWLETRSLPFSARRVGAAVATIAIVSAIAGPAAYALDTAATPHSGAIPTAGPSGQGGFGGPGGGPGGAPPAFARQGAGTTQGQGGFGGPPSGAFQGGQGQGGPGARAGGLGGLLDTATPSSALVTALKQNASSYTWVAAAVGANSAAGVQIASGEPIMAIGGFNGTDPTPTLAAFQKLVSQSKIHYFLAGGMGGGPGGGRPGGGGPGGIGSSSSSQSISSWVESNFTSTTIGGVTVYDLSSGLTTG
jgi:4-amino-4-deoxy-L-arabinose transferase-like glycosyltransferase